MDPTPRTSFPPNFGTNPCGPGAPRNAPNLRVLSRATRATRMARMSSFPMPLLVPGGRLLLMSPLFCQSSFVLVENNQFVEVAALVLDYLSIEQVPSSNWAVVVGQQIGTTDSDRPAGECVDGDERINEISLFCNKTFFTAGVL